MRIINLKDVFDIIKNNDICNITTAYENRAYIFKANVKFKYEKEEFFFVIENCTNDLFINLVEKNPLVLMEFENVPNFNYELIVIDGIVRKKTNNDYKKTFEIKALNVKNNLDFLANPI